MSELSLPREDLDHVLAHTRDAWDELRGQRLFITGGTGFFGMWLLESFVWANRQLGLEAQATVLTRDPAQFAAQAPQLAREPSLCFCRGDVRDFAFPEGRFSHIIHAATPAKVELNRDEPLTMLDIIVGGTRRVLDFAVACGATKLLLTSSGAIYGRQPPNVTHVAEEYAGGPETTDAGAAYGEGKRVAELLSTLYARQFGLQAKIARCFAFVGPYLPLDRQYAVGNFLRDALAGGPIRVQGDGTPYRSYLYAADLAIWLWTVFFRGESCRPYNIGSDEGVTIDQLARCIAQSAGGEVAVNVLEKPASNRIPSRYVPKVSRAREELGLAVWIALPEAVRRSVEFLRKQPFTGVSPATSA